MEPDEYRRMFEVEEALWWYRALRLYLADAFDRASLPRAARILDVGCGSGGNLAMLAGRFGRVIGCDLSEEAVRLCRTRGIARVLAADVNHLPFRERRLTRFSPAMCSKPGRSMRSRESLRSLG